MIRDLWHAVRILYFPATLSGITVHRIYFLLYIYLNCHKKQLVLKWLKNMRCSQIIEIIYRYLRQVANNMINLKILGYAQLPLALLIFFVATKNIQQLIARPLFRIRIILRKERMQHTYVARKKNSKTSILPCRGNDF